MSRQYNNFASLGPSVSAPFGTRKIARALNHVVNFANPFTTPQPYKSVYLLNNDAVTGKNIVAIEVQTTATMGANYGGVDLPAAINDGVLSLCNSAGVVITEISLATLVRGQNNNKLLFTNIKIDTAKSFITFSTATILTGLVITFSIL